MSEVYRLRSFGLGLAAEDGILRADTLTGLAGAEALVAAAETEAARLREEAQEAYETEKLRGYEDGLAEAARRAAGQLAANALAVDRQLRAMERDLGHLVHDCVRRILERHSDEELALELARSALSTMRNQRRGQLYAAPGIDEELRAALPGLVAEFPEIELVDVIADATLARSDLRLETDLGVVSFVLDDTLAQLRELLETAEA